MTILFLVAEEHQDGDYLATVTISGNVAMAEQLINERLREQFQPRLGQDGKTLQGPWEFEMWGLAACLRTTQGAISFRMPLICDL